MKKNILITILAIGMLSAMSASAQYDPKTDKKNRKGDKKEAKAMKKDDNGLERKGYRKHEKAEKKTDKMSLKEAQGK